MDDIKHTISLDIHRFPPKTFANMLIELENSSRIDFINKYIPSFSNLVQTKLLCIKTDIMFNTALTTSLLATRWKRKTSSSKLNKLS